MENDVQKELNEVRKQMADLATNVVDVIAKKIPSYVGIRNVALGEKYFKSADGRELMLAGAGKSGDTLIVDYMTWQNMKSNDGSVKLGYTVRDDSFLTPDYVRAPLDNAVSPNAISNDDIQDMLKMTKTSLESRLSAINNIDVLERIKESFSQESKEPVVALGIVNHAIDILRYNLPSNFFTMNKQQLEELAKDRGLTDIPIDIKTISALRQEILEFLGGTAGA